MIQRVLALAVLAFAFLGAPQVRGLRSPVPQILASTPPTADPAIPLPDDFLFKLIKDADAPAAKMERPKNLPKGQKWVPVYSFSESVNDESVDKLATWLKNADKAGADAVLIEIDSGGGGVNAGMRLVRTIEDANMKVHCAVDGMAASMAFAILQSCDERSATSRSELMAHEPSISGLFFFQPQDVRNLQQRLDLVTKVIIKQYSKRMKGGAKRVQEKISGGKEWWMDSDEALEEGAVDCVVPSRAQLLKAYEAGKTCHEAPKMTSKKKR